MVILVGCIIPDDQIDWYDNVMLLGWYTFYIIFLAFNESIMNKLAPHDETVRTFSPCASASICCCVR